MAKTYSTETDLLPEVTDHLADLAREALDQGDKKFSVRKGLDSARSELQLKVNGNNQKAYTAALIRRVPAISPLIERRNTGRGPNKSKLPVELQGLAVALEKGCKIGSVTLQVSTTLGDGSHVFETFTVTPGALAKLVA